MSQNNPMMNNQHHGNINSSSIMAGAAVAPGNAHPQQRGLSAQQKGKTNKDIFSYHYTHQCSHNKIKTDSDNELFSCSFLCPVLVFHISIYFKFNHSLYSTGVAQQLATSKPPYMMQSAPVAQFTQVQQQQQQQIMANYQKQKQMSPENNSHYSSSSSLVTPTQNGNYQSIAGSFKSLNLYNLLLSLIHSCTCYPFECNIIDHDTSCKAPWALQALREWGSAINILFTYVTLDLFLFFPGGSIGMEPSHTAVQTTGIPGTQVS